MESYFVYPILVRTLSIEKYKNSFPSNLVMRSTRVDGNKAVHIKLWPTEVSRTVTRGEVLITKCREEFSWKKIRRVRSEDYRFYR